MPFSKGNIKNLAVTWYDATDSYVTNTEITADIKGIPLFTDTGTGEVNQARIVVRAARGRYITGTSPIPIDQFDRIHLTLSDIAGNSYDRWFEVDSIIPSQSKSEGTLLTLDCLGIEYYLQKMHFSKPFWFTDGASVSRFIIDKYNKRKGTLQPTISEETVPYNTTTKVGNAIPAFTLANYEYGKSEDTYYNRLIDLIEKFGGSVALGGVRDFFELGFTANGVNALKIRLFSGGVTPASPITIENTLSINVGDQEGGIENETGRVINGWGSNTHGTLPTDGAKYRSGIFQFIFRPIHSSSVTYQKDAKVLLNGKHYKSDIDNNTSTPPTNWTQIDMSDEFGDTIERSAWTTQKRALWVNSGANPDPSGGITIGTNATGTANLTAGKVTSVTITAGGSGYFGTATVRFIGGTGTNVKGAKGKVTLNAGGAVTAVTVIDQGDNYTVAPTVEFSGGGAKALINSTGSYLTRAMFFDSNLTIDHEGFKREWVNERVEGDGAGGTIKTADVNYLYTNVDWPRGHRLLSIKDGLGGTDRNGRSFSNTIVERIKTRDGNPALTEWKIIYEFNDTNDKAQIVVIDEAATYQWEKATSTFTNISTSANIDSKGLGGGNDCFHDWKSIANVQGFDQKASITDSQTYPEISKDRQRFAKGEDSAIEVVYAIPNIIEGTFDVDSFYRKGAWLNFAFPYPINKFNGITETVGDLYGGGTISGSGGDNEPATLDITNMGYSHDGLIGFNNGDSTEDLGTINSIAFAIRIRMLGPLGNPLNGAATVKVSCYDTASHKAETEFEVAFTDGTWQPVNLPISGFSIQKSNRPRWTTHSAIIDAALAQFINIIPPTEQEVVETFEWRNLKMIAIQVNNFYDQYGRYAPENNVADMDNHSLITALGGKIMLAIDDFHFKKPLLVNSGRDSVRAIEPTFIQRTGISLYDQLRADVEAEEEIQKFRHKEFTFKTSGNAVFDVDFGDHVYLKNINIVSDDDNPADPDNASILLVARRIEYSITKPSAGAGGLTRTIKGVKRFI